MKPSVSRVLELTYTAVDLAAWARDLGYEGAPFRWDPDRRALLRAELDAWYARAYGLTPDELRYVLDPADVMGPDWPSETFRVLTQNEERQFSEYRTRHLVLDAYGDLLAGRPMLSEIAIVPEILRRPIPIRPTNTADEHAMLLVFALVRAAGDRISHDTLVNAFALRRDPERVQRLAPLHVAASVPAWASATRHTPDEPSARATVAALVEGRALTWAFGEASQAAIVTNERTPAENELEDWFRYEAHLLLGVARAMTSTEVQALMNTLPDTDRTLAVTKSA